MTVAKDLGYGMPIVPSGTLSFNNFAVNTATSQAEWIFLAREAATITQLGCRLGAITGASPDYKISLQGVSAGNPDGTIKGGASPASKVFNPSSLGWANGSWNWLTLDNAFTIARGDMLSIVIAYTGALTIDGTHTSSFTLTMSGGVGTYQFPGSTQNASGSRTKLSGFVIYGYASASKAYGRPMAAGTTQNFNSGSAPNEYAMKFTLPSGEASTYQVAGVRFAMLPTSGHNLLIQLYDTDGTTVLQSLTFDTTVTPGAAVRLCDAVHFSTANLATLNYGSAYRLGFAPQDATNQQIEWIDVAAASDWDAWPYGQDLMTSSRTGAGAWTDTATRRLFAEPIIHDITASGGGDIMARQLLGM